MMGQYPPYEDPEHTAGEITSRYAISALRNALLFKIAEDASGPALTELKRLKALHPTDGLLARAIEHAYERARRISWQPQRPKDLFALCENREHRIVESEDQLLSVVLFALGRLQVKLQAETPAAQFLWDKDRPKEEEALSDWVKVELQEALVNRGIILGREVQVNLKDKTDIHIDTFAEGSVASGDARHLKVIIEVKGCWHPQLKTAMEEQLVKKYLSASDCKHGIYLVGWYQCPAWNQDDRRKRTCSFATKEDLLGFLEKQAKVITTAVVKPMLLDVTITGMPRATRKAKTKESPGKPSKTKVKPLKAKKTPPRRKTKAGRKTSAKTKKTPKKKTTKQPTNRS